MSSESSRYVLIVSTILKIMVIVFAIIGLVITYSGNKAFMGGRRAFMYFTIQSNLALAIICAIDGLFMIKKNKGRKFWFIVRFMGVVSITLTGIVFCLFLAPTIGASVWNTQNTITHMAVPIIAIADFLLTETYSNNLICAPYWGTLSPLAYTVYAGIGYLNKWEFASGTNYPYTFLNWGSPAGALGFSRDTPFIGCIWWILILLLLTLFIGRIYIIVLDTLRKYITQPAS